MNAAHWVEYQICHPAAALMLGGILWACMHPASFHVAKCLAAALDVQAGYAVTVRQTARGQLLEGEQAIWLPSTFAIHSIRGSMHDKRHLLNCAVLL